MPHKGESAIVVVAVAMSSDFVGRAKIICSADVGEGERQQVGVLEGRAAREPASIVFCFRWVSPHREGTDSMRFLLRAGEKSGSAVE